MTIPFHHAQAFGVLVFDLGIQQAVPGLSQAMRQMNQRNLRSISPRRRSMEHGFTKERRSKRQTIQPAHQYAITPSFHRMGATNIVGFEKQRS